MVTVGPRKADELTHAQEHLAGLGHQSALLDRGENVRTTTSSGADEADAKLAEGGTF